MSNWIHITLTIPVEYADVANRLAAIFDPDSGGADTFGSCKLSVSGELPATHYMAGTVIKNGYFSLLENNNPIEVHACLEALAIKRERELPEMVDVEVWCSNITIGDVEGLMEIVEDL